MKIPHTGHIEGELDPYQALSKAVILCAVNDFREAARLIRRFRRRMNARKKPDDAKLHRLRIGVEKCESIQEDIARFLLSVHFMSLCDLDGSSLLDRLESEVA